MHREQFEECEEVRRWGGGGKDGEEDVLVACCLRPTTFLQIATASAITAARERLWEWCCMKERGLEVARPYRVRSTAEAAPEARLPFGEGVECWRLEA
eukprot:scaffold13603_cov112-Isochrysis_galbana.AAC.9